MKTCALRRCAVLQALSPVAVIPQRVITTGFFFVCSKSADIGQEKSRLYASGLALGAGIVWHCRERALQGFNGLLSRYSSMPRALWLDQNKTILSDSAQYGLPIPLGYGKWRGFTPSRGGPSRKKWISGGKMPPPFLGTTPPKKMEGAFERHPP